MTQVSITIPNDIRAYLELRAERHGLSLEMLLRQAVELISDRRTHTLNERL
jgi:hypothetical protein